MIDNKYSLGFKLFLLSQPLQGPGISLCPLCRLYLSDWGWYLYKWSHIETGLILLFKLAKLLMTPSFYGCN